MLVYSNATVGVMYNPDQNGAWWAGSLVRAIKTETDMAVLNLLLNPRSVSEKLNKSYIRQARQTTTNFAKLSQMRSIHGPHVSQSSRGLEHPAKEERCRCTGSA